MKTLEQIRESMIQGGLGEYFDQLAPYARNVIRITPEVCDDGDIPVGASKFGGCPDLPDGMEWYQAHHGSYAVPLRFVAQINFAETAPFDTEHQLPERGILYFFYDGEADASLDWLPVGNGMGWKVIFYEGDLTALSRREPPANLGEYDDGCVYGAARLTFAAQMQLPPLESDLLRYREFPEDKEQYRRYLDWTVETDCGCYSQLLGHANVTFHGMERDCECLRQKLSCTLVGLKELAERGQDRDLSHWKLLLQVDSNRDTDMIWSDMGWLCLWITGEDLAARRFENCWLLRESG